MWDDLEVTLTGPVDVALRGTVAGSGELVVRGSLVAALEQECRRCLEPVAGALDTELTLVFVPDAASEEEDDGETRPYDAGASELDLSRAVREELILGIDPFVVCDPECKGLCPRCGANRNLESCDCTEEESDPRWDALRALKKE